MNRNRAKGFTLIEIIIALAIVAIAVLAIMNSTNSHARVSGALEKTIIANWVASNVITRAQHEARTERVKNGRSSDFYEMGGHRWSARSIVSTTEVENVYLLTVEVRDDRASQSDPLSSMTTALLDQSQ